MSEKTTHNHSTPHGLKTVHKLPSKGTTKTDIQSSLASQLYPTGRAWALPENGVYKALHDAVNKSFVRLQQDMDLFIDSILPDNDNFTEEDADLMEYKYGLITNSSVDLNLRKKAIIRKMGQPNSIKARQHPLYMQYQLQLAGFDVYVHENTVPYRSPEEIVAISLTDFQHGGISQHGDGAQHGGNNFNVIANSIEPIEQYSTGGSQNLWATIFLGGQTLGETAFVPENRLPEFKELVIKLKPAHIVAFTFIEYI